MKNMGALHGDENVSAQAVVVGSFELDGKAWVHSVQVQVPQKSPVDGKKARRKSHASATAWVF